MPNALTNSSKAIRYAGLKGLVTGKAKVLPAPGRNVVFNRDIQSALQTQTADNGTTVVQGQLNNGEQPVVTLPYDYKTKEILALALGLKLATGTYNAIVSRTFQPSKTSYAAAAAGKEGNGMVADNPDSTMSALVNGISVQLTRQNFGTFNGATPLSFAQGADGALKVSNDIVASKLFVTTYFPYEVSSSDVVQEEAEEDFELTLVGVMDDLTIFNLRFSSVFLDIPAMGQISFGEAAQNLIVRPNIGGDACAYFTMAFLDREFACAA